MLSPTSWIPTTSTCKGERLHGELFTTSDAGVPSSHRPIGIYGNTGLNLSAIEIGQVFYDRLALLAAGVRSETEMQKTSRVVSAHIPR